MQSHCKRSYIIFLHHLSYIHLPLKGFEVRGKANVIRNQNTVPGNKFISWTRSVGIAIKALFGTEGTDYWRRVKGGCREKIVSLG